MSRRQGASASSSVPALAFWRFRVVSEFKKSVSQPIAVAEAVLYGQTIDEYEPDGEAVKEFAALADAVDGLLP